MNDFRLQWNADGYMIPHAVNQNEELNFDDDTNDPLKISYSKQEIRKVIFFLDNYHLSHGAYHELRMIC